MVGCEKCKGATFVHDEETDEWAPCECRRVRDVEKLLEIKLKGTGIPKSYAKYSLETYNTLIKGPQAVTHNKTYLDTLEQYIKDPKLFMDNYKTLWIHGTDANAGHTALAIILGVALLDAKYKVRFMEMQTLINYFTNFEEKDSFINSLMEYDVYIIDDAFDKTRIAVKDYSRVQLFQFINKAFNEDKHFIMTSNVPLNGIVDDKDNKFEQCRIVLQRSIKQMEITGSFNFSVEESQVQIPIRQKQK
jgi:DNA replication protein DnaC